MKKIASRSALWKKGVLLPLILTVSAVAIHWSVAPAAAFGKGAAWLLSAWDANDAPAVLAQAVSRAPELPVKPQQSTSRPSEPMAQSSAPQEVPKPPESTTQTAAPAVKQAQPAKPQASEPEQAKEAEGKGGAEEVQEAGKGEKSELDNQSCLDCHNPDILQQSKEERSESVVVGEKALPPRPMPKYSYGELSLSIVEKKYRKGVHADTNCIECHNDITELPHNQRLQLVDCALCHEESVGQVKDSAHGGKSLSKCLACVGCHDVHYGKGSNGQAKAVQAGMCVDCHKAYGMNPANAHKNLHEYGLHEKAMGCLTCHQSGKPSAHTIPPVKTKVTGCTSCHTRYTILSSEEPKSTDFFRYITKSRFINADVLKKYDYVIGANRIPLLDTLVVLVVIGPLGLPVAHGGLRFLTRRKEPIQLPKEKILLHPLLERIWHWLQALCIVMLIVTGIMMHWPEQVPNWFNWAVTWHNWFGWGAVIVWLYWLIYILASGRVTHYIPRQGDIPDGMIRQARFYGYGIFKHEPHPYAPSEDNKFNPLQKIAYLQFQVLLFPLLLASGLLYMYPSSFPGIIGAIGGMMALGVIHYLLGAIFASFLVAHLYLATTGETIGENFKAIVWGYGPKFDHEEHHT